MVYVPNCKHDVFVSYAHVDDDPLPGATKGWVTTFVGCLKTRLAQKLGRSDAYSLWMDHELESGEQISDQILNNVRQAATLVVVLSPGYVASTWCRRERDTFLRLVREHGNRPVFVVERDWVDNRERPEELSDLKAFRFWVQEREGKAPRILGSPCPDASDHEYYNQIDDLSQDIVTGLHRLKSAAGGRAGAPAAVEGSAPRPTSSRSRTVFLAQVTDDIDLERNSVKRYLVQAGVEVLPAIWYSQEPNAFRASAERDLTGSDLFVQLLSGTAGKKPVDLQQGYPKFQAELALTAGKPILQWRSPTLDVAMVEDEAHRALLEATTVRAESLEDFKREILKRVSEEPQPVPPAKTNIFVFVDMESADRSLAEQICGILDRYGAEYALPIQSGNPSDNRHDLEQNLSECDALIVIYGMTTVSWVRGQLLEARKAVAFRQRPLRALAVFEGPPEEKSCLDMKIQNMKILNLRKGISEDEVRRFLEGLAAETAA